MLIFKPETNSIVTVLSVLSNRENRIAAEIITIPESIRYLNQKEIEFTSLWK